jgi:hypothetical protein
MTENETSRGIGKHQNPTLNDFCTITVNGNIPTTSNNYETPYQNDVIRLRISESNTKENAYDVTIFSTSDFWDEFSPMQRRRRQKPYVDEIKNQINDLLQKETNGAVKLKSLKMSTGRASMAKGGSIGGYTINHDKGKNSGEITTPLIWFQSRFDKGNKIIARYRNLRDNEYQFWDNFGGALFSFEIEGTTPKMAYEKAIDRLKSIFKNGVPQKRGAMFEVSGYKFDELNKKLPFTPSFMTGTHIRNIMGDGKYKTEKGELLKFDDNGDGWDFYYLVDAYGTKVEDVPRLKGSIFSSLFGQGIIEPFIDKKMAKGGGVGKKVITVISNNKDANEIYKKFQKNESIFISNDDLRLFLETKYTFGYEDEQTKTFDGDIHYNYDELVKFYGFKIHFANNGKGRFDGWTYVIGTHPWIDYNLEKGNLDKSNIKSTGGSMYKKGGHVVGQTLKFKDYNGDIRTGEIIELLKDGDYSVRSGFSSVLVTPSMIIKFEEQPVRKKMFGLFEDGGNINSNIIVIYVNEYPYYLKKAGDTTHLYMANSREGVDIVIPGHIGQYNGTPYYNDIRTWLKGGESPNGKKYTESFKEGGSIDVKKTDGRFLNKISNRVSKVWDEIGADSGGQIRSDKEMLNNYASKSLVEVEKLGLKQNSLTEKDFSFYKENHFYKIV